MTMEKDFVLSTSAGTMVNIKTIPDMDYITDDGSLKIGALATLTDIAESSVVKSKWASLAEAARRVGTPQLRNMGTLGGNLCQECRSAGAGITGHTITSLTASGRAEPCALPR